jgi:phosphoribosylformimino-5-aminoimidazole carboxamide ribotide isomerase
MIVIPAIDLRGGKCVRLTQGDFARETVYGEDPVAMAERWQAEGASWLHVVDLDGAVAGRPIQLAIARAMLARVTMAVELGGGVRSPDDARAAFAAGIRRLVLGTVALESPDVLESVCHEFPGRVYVALDARDGKVAVRGWRETTAVTPLEAARRCKERGAAGVLFTDISRDGTREGVNVEATAALAEAVGMPVIASGGVGSLDDVRRVRAAASRGIEAVIIGRALYTGAVRLADAIAEAGRGLAAC